MDNTISIRNVTEADLPVIQEIYAYARQQMKVNGNPTQWGDDRPPIKAIEEDIRKQQNFLILEDNEPCGVFAFIIGEDPTYLEIEDGQWLNDEPYGVIHRIASNGKCKGIMNIALEFCQQQVSNIRIDTHKDNHIMQHILEREGFERCGIIYVDDGTPRIAYQKIVCKELLQAQSKGSFAKKF